MTNIKLFTEENIFNFDEIEITEKEKTCIEYIKSLTESIQHSNTTFFKHLYNTFRILKNLNAMKWKEGEEGGKGESVSERIG